MSTTTTYDPTGAQLNQTSTNSGSSSGNIAFSFYGHYWNTAGLANTYNYLVNMVVNQNTNPFTIGLQNATWKATNAGTVTGVSMFEAGPANGTHTVQILKNGTVAQTVTMGTGGNGVNWQQPANVVIAKDDVISAQVANTVAGNTQVNCVMSFLLSAN